MPITILEKLVYTVPVVILYMAGRVLSNIMSPSLVDPMFGVLFIIAYFRTAAPESSLAKGR